MIVVSISTTNIAVDGHAGYAEPGKDIICSAVSVLTFNLTNRAKIVYCSTKIDALYQMLPNAQKEFLRMLED